MLPERVQSDPDMREAARNALAPAAKIAGGCGIEGDDDNDQLGMRLAVYKRGLTAVNTALDSLNAAKGKNIYTDESLSDFIKRATELRNALAMRIQEAREKFNGV